MNKEKIKELFKQKKLPIAHTYLCLENMLKYVENFSYELYSDKELYSDEFNKDVIKSLDGILTMVEPKYRDFIMILEYKKLDETEIKFLEASLIISLLQFNVEVVIDIFKQGIGSVSYIVSKNDIRMFSNVVKSIRLGAYYLFNFFYEIADTLSEIEEFDFEGYKKLYLEIKDNVFNNESVPSSLEEVMGYDFFTTFLDIFKF